MKNITCLLIGLTIGAAASFYPGKWYGEVITLRPQASAPGVDPVYADANSDVAVYRSRAKMEGKGH